MSYEEIQAQRNREAARNYSEWVESLAPEERETLAQKKLDRFDHPARAENFISLELRETAANSFDPRREDPPQEPCTHPQANALDMLRAVLGEIMAAPSVRLTLDCFSLVLGFCYSGDAQVSIAKKHGVTRAAVSKRCVILCDRLGLPPLNGMRRRSARESYSAARRERLQKIFSSVDEFRKK